MSRRKKQKPLFKKRYTQGQIALRTVVSIIILAVLLFVGISVGKPLVERFFPTAVTTPNEIPDTPDVSSEQTDTPTQTTPPTEETNVTTTEPPVIKQGIYYFSFPEEGQADTNLQLLLDALQLAVEENYRGFCVELISVGGRVNYTTQNKLAQDAQAVNAGALSLDEIAGYITDCELLPYARISVLSDNIASWRDRSICYLFEDSSSKWLDNSLSNGGKPWISPFSDSAKEYISSFVAEISDAGFAGVVAGEFEFPPFRQKDLGYVGAIVQSPTRYTALCEFSNILCDTLGTAKEYYIEVDACEVLEGECEILSDTSLLNSAVIYVKYDAQHIGTRIEKPDGSIVSFEGLNEVQKMTQMYRLINTQLSETGLRLIPGVSANLTDEEIYAALGEIGFKPDNIVIY